jgi:uncharacterized protein YxeA
MEKEKMFKTLEAERNRDYVELERQKMKFINDLKQLKKEDIVKPKIKKVGFFTKLKILLWGS